MSQNYVFNRQHDVYSELKKKSIFEKNNQTKAAFFAKNNKKELNVKNYTRTNTLVEDVTVLDFERTGCSNLYIEVFKLGAINYGKGKETGGLINFVGPLPPIPGNSTQ